MATKIIRINQGCLRIGGPRKVQRTINRMERKGWDHFETTSKWGSTMLTFKRD